MKEYRFRVLMIYEPPEPRQGKYEEEKKRKKNQMEGKGDGYLSQLAGQMLLGIAPAFWPILGLRA